MRAEHVRAAIRQRMVKALREATSLLQDGIFSQEEFDNQKGLILQGRIEQAAHSVWKAEEEAAAVAAVATVAGPAVAAVTIAVCAAKAGHALGARHRSLRRLGVQSALQLVQTRSRGQGPTCLHAGLQPVQRHGSQTRRRARGSTARKATNFQS